jgi:hypothetical protein
MRSINANVKKLIDRSEKFYNVSSFRKVSKLDNRITSLLSDDPENLIEIANNIAHYSTMTYPVVHAKIITAIQQYIDLVEKLCHDARKDIYKGLTPIALISRLLTHRPVVFYTNQDIYMLKNGIEGQGGFLSLSSHSDDMLSLHHLINYDEICFSALISMSVPTYFINNGSRSNRGCKQDKNILNYIDNGVYVASVGARFEMTNLMDWKYVVVSIKQNTKENGYGESNNSNDYQSKLLHIWYDLFSSDYNEYPITSNQCNDYVWKNYYRYFPTYEEVLKLKDTNISCFNERYIKVDTSDHGIIFFDKYIYKRRMRLVIQPFLQDANSRANQIVVNTEAYKLFPDAKSVYVRAVGLGLGVWRLISDQNKLLVDVYKEILEEVPLPCISDIEFMHFGNNTTMTCGGVGHGQIFENTRSGNSIRIHFTDSNPADPIHTETENTKLLVAQYAWDGNAFPGNEYWLGQLSASSDPAAACCSLITELQNPEIN